MNRRSDSIMETRALFKNVTFQSLITLIRDFPKVEFHKKSEDNFDFVKRSNRDKWPSTYIDPKGFNVPQATDRIYLLSK